MITPRMNGSSTALAQITKAKNSAALIARNTTRALVQPPEGRPNGGVFKLAEPDTTPPNPGHNVYVPATQGIASASASSARAAAASPPRNTKPNEPESATRCRRPRLACRPDRVRSRVSGTRSSTFQFESLSSAGGGGGSLALLFKPASLSLNTSPKVAPLPVDSRLST